MQIKFLVNPEVTEALDVRHQSNLARMHAVAAGKPGSPFKRDLKGNLHSASNGRFVSVK